MKRIEVKLALPVVAPLLDVIRELAAGLRKNLAAPLGPQDLDAEFAEAWTSELLESQSADVTALLPSDGANFGFDNVATALKTSPLLLERYVTAAQRISTLAVGDPKERPGTTEYSVSREFSQSGHLDGLPLGTRGGTVVRHIFPAYGEYKLAGRLFRGIEEGYVGVESNDTPFTFVITIDGDEVFSAHAEFDVRQDLLVLEGLDDATERGEVV